MVETWKFGGPCKSIVTEDGIELSYCEYGGENEEVVITGAFYFHTWLPVVTGLAEHYHVYGVIMRFGDGEGTMLNEDGSIHWAKQWGDDIYQFAKAMGISKFHYVGKCHGSTPGWYLIKEHPEMVESFCSFYLSPHITEQNSDHWHDKVTFEEQLERTQRGGQEGVKKKAAEMKALSMKPAGYGGTPPAEKYQMGANLLWNTPEECLDFVRNLDIPVCYMFGTDDILFKDWLDNNVMMMCETKRSRTVILQGERHLMCMDAPDRIVSEVDFFIQETKKGYK